MEQVASEQGKSFKPKHLVPLFALTEAVTRIRCRLLGILIGLGFASSVASTYVIDRYKSSQQELLVVVQQLQQSTDQVSWSYGHGTPRFALPLRQSIRHSTMS